MKHLLIIMCLFVALGATAQPKESEKKQSVETTEKYSPEEKINLIEAIDALKIFNKNQKEFAPYQKLLQDKFMQELKSDSILIVDKKKLEQPYISSVTIKGKTYTKVTQMYEETQTWVQKPANQQEFNKWLGALEKELKRNK